MPKLRAIDFNKIKNGDKAEAKRVIKDLLMLTPRGPKQNQRGTDYFKFECYPGKEAILLTAEDFTNSQIEGDRRYQISGYSREANWWGYTNEQLYYTAKALGATGTYVGESDFSNLLHTHFYEEGYRRGAKLTRGCRRLSNRFARAWKQAITNGNLGDLAFTCRVNTPQVEGAERYYGPTTQTNINISFAGRTDSEAKMMLQTMFGHCVQEVDPGFTAWQAAEPADILQRNLAEVTKLQDARAKAQSQLARIQEYITNLDALEEAVQMYSMSICD
jgi:hypothetical protein